MVCRRICALAVGIILSIGGVVCRVVVGVIVVILLVVAIGVFGIGIGRIRLRVGVMLGIARRVFVIAAVADFAEILKVGFRMFLAHADPCHRLLVSGLAAAVALPAGVRAITLEGGSRP